ncbi:hypothetical protein [Amphritea sp.]|uniref:hypothetical protein n=1 Tax=Amphritea sp. TaxID=1872502 RepID=UPI003A8F0D16
MIAFLVFLIIILLLGGAIWWPILAGMLGITNITDKASAVHQITQLIERYDISLNEIDTALQTPANSILDNRSRGDILRTLLAYLGGIFILAGISTYIGMFWDSIGTTMRILTTLGVGYSLLMMLLLALHKATLPRFVLPLTLAAATMMTGGWFVLIHELYPLGDNEQVAALSVFALMVLHQWGVFFKYRPTSMLFTGLFFSYGFLSLSLDLLEVPSDYIAIVLGTSIFLIGSALEKTSHRVLAEPALLIGTCWLNGGLFERVMMLTSINWASLVIGLCIIFTAYGMQRSGRYQRLIVLGYLFGSIMAYSGLFDLLQNTAIELVYLAIAAMGLYVCVALQSRILLLTTVVAMLGFIVYFSEQHFANAIGWPATLVLIGIAFLGIGAIAIKLKQRI